jgi:hypothetical protein
MSCGSILTPAMGFAKTKQPHFSAKTTKPMPEGTGQFHIWIIYFRPETYVAIACA